ncbi:Gfo/Idh/MocA family oxidoreductase, partial [Pseudomonas aeruginosa]|uniref:Gfo/Idh/MocA family oxidoreductase n=1 Tax=Pseudomonas aeruginosa TaxID=287 RepID=UPI0039C3AE8E
SGWGAHAARVFADSEHTRLAGIVGNGSERTRALATELGVPWFTQLATAVAAVQPEISSVAVHETVNAPMVEALLAAGSHILCSHPVATSASD